MQPDYVAFDHKQREEYLSQLGNFSPGERDLFHRLCQNWQERIPYPRFAQVIARSDGGTAAELASLLEKLKRRAIGLMRTHVVDGERSREAIVLCAPRSREFYGELIDEIFVDNQESINAPLPLFDWVRENHGDVPSTVLEPVSTDDLTAIFTTGETDGRILAIPTFGDAMVLVRGHNLRALLTIAIQKLRFHLNNTNLLGFFAKATDTSLLNLKHQCAGKDAGFWLSFTTTVAERRHELEALRSVTVDQEFYHVASLVHTVIESQVAAAAARRKAEEERELDLEAVAGGVRDAPEGWVEQAQLTRMLESQREKYGDQFPAFKEEFYDRFVTQRGRSTLPALVRLERRYIHRENLYPLFQEHFRLVTGPLKDEFLAQMEHQLRSGNRRGVSTFYSLENFDDAILEQIRLRSEVLAALIARPATLAEAMILHVKRNKLAQDVGELKRHLGAYFDPETMKPLPLHQWFNLRPVELFELAFERLPVWRRILMRLTGRYENVRMRFLNQMAGVPDGRAGGASGSPTRTRRTTRRSKQREKPADNRSAGTPPNSQRRITTVRPERRHSYSKQQVDSAWEQFSSTIRKRD